MASQWFICKTNGERQGPYTPQQLRQMALDGRLLPDEHLWREGLAKPARARKVQGLFGPKAAAPPPPVPSPPPLPHEPLSTVQSAPAVNSPNDAHALRTQRGREFLESQAANLKRGRDLLGTAVGGAKRLMAEAITEANRTIDESEQITISDRLVVGRSSKHCDWLIPHPTVATRHFELVRDGNEVAIHDLGAETGTFVNGTRIARQTSLALKSGDTVAAGPYVFRLNGVTLQTISKGQHAHLLCMSLSKDVTSHDSGDTIRILNQVTLDILPGEFVVLLGPSGSGKSTLMNALSGRSLATSGDVLLNEQNLYANFAALKKRLAIVPQKDLLHDRLTLRSALSYTADLRLPHDITAKEKDALVEAAISQVEMTEKANLPISTYSGGQIKRASLAIELLSNPSLLFIDEATSGLDENSDREIMRMLRKLADEGKTIVCITHNLGNVEECAHCIVVMANGGYLAYVGTPQETLEYFSIANLGQLYQRLKEKTGPEWADAFARSQKFADMAAAANKRLSIAGRPEVSREAVTRLQKIGVCIRHLRTTARRNVALQLKDRRALLVAGLQPLLVAFLIVILFGKLKGLDVPRYAPQVLFLLGISAFWFGCNNAAKEIVKERALFEKERNAGLDAVGYLMSKFLLLAGFTAVQSAFLLCAVVLGTDLDGSIFAYGLTLFVTGVCGVSLGLAISAAASDTDVAATAVPLAIIPQVILAGAIRPVEGISQLISAIFAPCYWCFGTLSNSLLAYFELESKDPMWSQQSFFLSICILVIFTAAFLLMATSFVTGIRITEFAKPAEIEMWLRSMSNANGSVAIRPRPNSSASTLPKSQSRKAANDHVGSFD